MYIHVPSNEELSVGAVLSKVVVLDTGECTSVEGESDG